VDDNIHIVHAGQSQKSSVIRNIMAMKGKLGMRRKAIEAGLL
jgi:hypothetical protein